MTELKSFVTQVIWMLMMNVICLRIKFQFCGCFDLFYMCKEKNEAGTEARSLSDFHFSFVLNGSHEPINKALVRTTIGDLINGFSRRILTLEFILCSNSQNNITTPSDEVNLRARRRENKQTNIPNHNTHKNQL